MEKSITVEITEKEAIQIQALLEVYIREQMKRADKMSTADENRNETLKLIDYYTNLQKKFKV